MPPIKVLHLIPSLLSGGAERQLANLVSNTSKENFSHVVCVIGDASFYAPFIEKAGWKLIEFGISAKRPFFRAAAKFREIIRQENPDIIHSWLYDANVAARLANVFGTKAPIITSLQLADYEPEAHRIAGYNPYKISVLRAIDKFTSMLARQYFAPCSEFVKKSYRRNYGIDEAKTQVIYNSVDPELLAASEADLKKTRASLPIPAGAFIYLNVGRFDPQKNHKLLLEAFRLAAAEIPNAYLLLAGVGNLQDAMKSLAKELNISEKVVFLGRRDDVGALLELADVFVFPSFFEGLPLALIEAMFKSLPCIASRIEVFEEVITDGENGLLVDPNSAAELKDAMIKLYKDENLRAALGENALREAQKNFNSATTAAQWENFYRKVKTAV